MRKILLLLASMPVLLILGSCSIKEDREACPGWLHLELSARSISLASRHSVRISVSQEGGADTLLLSADSKSGWIQVEKGRVEIKAMLDNGASDPGVWGEECDSLWAFSAAFPMHGGESSLEVSLHKRFATVWFAFDYAPDAEHSRLVIRSPGDFRCLLDASGGDASVRLPARSGDGPLELCCLSQDGSGVSWEWDLGAALLAAGYDWGAEDLSDAYVRVSLAPLDISVTVVPWEGNGGLIIEI